MAAVRNEIRITGIVQGVGFRPFVHSLANTFSLHGWVSNTTEGVVIDIEGESEQMLRFLEQLRNAPPRLSVIQSISVQEKPAVGYSRFEIKSSSASENRRIYISPDVAICEDCLHETYDPEDRRFQYPFTNCTNCGPRFTIVYDLPYDRERTTMSHFPMCPQCSAEYGDPCDRRYHAQPVSCPSCGPGLFLLDGKGERLAEGSQALAEAQKRLIQGQILAMKGIGGYHLACNAYDRTLIEQLRKRKQRDEKPFALMVSDPEIIGRHCEINEQEMELLRSPAAPIVLLQKKAACGLPEEIAPQSSTLGCMLPYTPLHALLFIAPAGRSSKPCLDSLVMTSGNISSEPIFYRDQEAITGLAGIADCFLVHNREIQIRTDDSVARVFNGKPYLIRRSRGYVPGPVTVNMPELLDQEKEGGIPAILACGGQMKNTFCINRGREFFLSPHMGDLDNLETLESFEEGIRHFKRLFQVECTVVACDLHPDYLSSRYAREREGMKRIEVQHHQAHVAACMADNGIGGDVIGIAFDGTGYGEDGTIWGGEYFCGAPGSFMRSGHLQYIPLPGGEAAIKEPWRIAAALVYHLEQSGDSELAQEGFDHLQALAGPGLQGVRKMLDRGLNCPSASSMGRLFDGISSLIGLRQTVTYEGQAAIELENRAEKTLRESYPFELLEQEGMLVTGVLPLVRGILLDLKAGVSQENMAARFHETVVRMTGDTCCRLRDQKGLNHVVLSGGVFQNILLLERTVTLLEKLKFKVYTHNHVPTNDGGIALGQAVIASLKLRGRCPDVRMT